MGPETSGKTNGKQRRGFALLPVERRQQIAALGGTAAHGRGTAHRFTADEARAAGRLGGCRDAGHMQRIGRLGGLSRAIRDFAWRSTGQTDRPRPRKAQEKTTMAAQHKGLTSTKRPSPWTAEQTARFLEQAVFEAGAGAELALVLLLQACLGLRLSELQLLRVVDVDFYEGQLAVRLYKQDLSPRRFELPDPLLLVLGHLAASRKGCDLLFRNSLDAWAVERYLRALCSTCKLPALTSHALRRLSAGWSSSTVSAAASESA